MTAGVNAVEHSVVVAIVPGSLSAFGRLVRQPALISLPKKTLVLLYGKWPYRFPPAFH